MSTQTQTTSTHTARNKIRSWLVSLGLATSTAKLDALATAVESIENRGAVSATVKEGDTYTIPKGYHNGSGTVSGVGGGGSYNLQSKIVTPTKSQQNITPDDGYYGLSDVTVNAIPDTYQDVSDVTAGAADVLASKLIVTTTGTVAGRMVNNGAVNASIDGLEVTEYTIPVGYKNGSGKVTLSNAIETALAAI